MVQQAAIVSRMPTTETHMYILVINYGSSSIKFTRFREKDLSVVAKGIVEKIGEPGTTIRFRKTGRTDQCRQIRIDHIQDAIEQIGRQLGDPESVGIDTEQITAVGHRVVHGGEFIREPSLVDDRVIQVIRSCFDLAPLDNPFNLECILGCENRFPGAPQAVVFDTAFHATISPHAFLYALPGKWYRKHKIRKYGFHGTSHRYVSRQAARKLGKPVEALRRHRSRHHLLPDAPP
jgi:acetate kinase